MLRIQEIKNAKPADKQRKLFDRDGLYLVVNPAGELHNHLKPRKKGHQTALAEPSAGKHTQPAYT